MTAGERRARPTTGDRGRVYIGTIPDEHGNLTLWRAHHEGPDGRMTESIDGDTPEDLVGWARQRTGWVLLADAAGTFWWAGTDPRPADVERDWPAAPTS